MFNLFLVALLIAYSKACSDYVTINGTQYAVNVCARFFMKGKLYSFKYACNAGKTEVDKVIYPTYDCWGAPSNTTKVSGPIGTFGCTDGSTTNDCHYSVMRSEMPIYTNLRKYSCSDSHFGVNWSEEPVLMDKCINYNNMSMKYYCTSNSQYSVYKYSQTNCAGVAEIKAPPFITDCIYKDDSSCSLIKRMRSITCSGSFNRTIPQKPCKHVMISGQMQPLDVCTVSYGFTPKLTYSTIYKCASDGKSVERFYYRNSTDCTMYKTTQPIKSVFNSGFSCDATTKIDCHYGIFERYSSASTSGRPNCRVNPDNMNQVALLMNECYSFDSRGYKLFCYKDGDQFKFRFYEYERTNCLGGITVKYIDPNSCQYYRSGSFYQRFLIKSCHNYMSKVPPKITTCNSNLPVVEPYIGNTNFASGSIPSDCNKCSTLNADKFMEQVIKNA